MTSLDLSPAAPTSADADIAGTVGTVTLTAAQAIVRFLQRQLTERDGETRRAIPAIFGIFGHGNVAGLGQAITEVGDRLPLYQPKNEQAMVHTALGFAKASRRTQTLACTASIGPGSTNMLTGAATAGANRLPVLLLPSDTFANRLQGPVLQQLEHPSEADVTVNDAFRPLSRFFDRISRPEQLLTALPEAMRVLFDPAETGAVTISLHQDVQGQAFDFPARFFEQRVWTIARRPPAQEQLARAVELLRGARHPLLIAGGGVRYSAAEQALRAFAASVGVPVAETSAGKGSLTDSDWLLGGVGVNGTRAANEIAAEADVVICLGTRLTDFTTGSHSLFQNPDVRFLGVNVNAADAHKLSGVPLVADAREALAALTSKLGESAQTPARREYREQVERRVGSWKADLAADIAPRAGERLGQGEVIETLNEAVQPGDWVIAAAGWQPGDLLKLWQTPAGSFTHIEFGFSCMGHEIPAGIGVRMHAGPEPEVFVVIGDGTYLMNPTELFTAVQEQLKLTVVLLDNGGYQSISRLALGKAGSSAGNEFRGRERGDRLPRGSRVGVDFVANAKSLGCESLLVESGEQLAAALAQARRHSGSTVIVCPTEPGRSLLGSGAFWDIGVAEVSSDPATSQAAAEHRRSAGVQRHY